MRVFRKLAAASSACLVVGLAAAPAQAEIGLGANNPEETLTAAPLPTWQTNGTVWDMAVVNGVAYVGGNFTKVRPPGIAVGGAGEVTRNRLAAFNAATGDLLSWAPSATSTPFTPTGTPDKNCTPVANGQIECATVWGISPTPDQKSIIVGGDFQAVDGKVRAGLAAFTAPTSPAGTILSTTNPGTLHTVFKPSVSGRIYSVAATNTGVWIGGSVTKAGGQTRTGLASFDFPSGTLRADFNPAVVKGTGQGGILTGVRKVVLTADGTRLIVGGGFNSIAGRAIHGLQAIDATTGAPATWNSNRIVNAAYVTNLKIYDNVVYTNGDASGSASEGIIAFDASTGSEIWYDGCRGASHSMALVRGVVYVGSHSHDCGSMEGGFGEQYNGYPEGDNRRYTLRAEVPNGIVANGTGGAKLLPWTPKTDDMNGARAMAFFEAPEGAPDSVPSNLWIGGEFTSVDYAGQQGLTRFGFVDDGGADRKPLKPTSPIATSSRPGVIDVSFQETEDPDNRQLTYQVYRDDNTTSPVFTATGSSPAWQRGWLQFQDVVAPGSTHTYDVRATDPLDSPSSRSDPTTITAASTSIPLSGLAKADGAAMQFSFESRVSGSYVDGVGGKTAAPQNGATTAAGNGASGNAMALSGSSSLFSRGVAVVGTREWTTRQFSVETMFKTNTTRGGSLVSFGSSNSTTSTSGSPTGNLYMDNSGRLNLGLQPNADRLGNPWGNPTLQRRAVTTAGSFNNNAWHHVVATFQPGTGARIFVDGTLVAQDATMNWTMPVNAYVRLGADSISGFPNSPSKLWWAGTLDEVATYKFPLSEKQVKAHSNAVFQALNVPDGLMGTPAGLTSVNLTWQPTDFATGYTVYRDGVVVGSPTTNSFSDTGLTAGTTYKYKVAATQGAAEGPATDEISVKTTDQLAKPTGLSGSATGQTSVRLTWTADPAATSYNVYRDGVAVGSPTGALFNDTGLTAGTTYTYKVAAVNVAGEGPATDEISVKTTVPAPLMVLARGATWKYDVSGAPAPDWSSASFDDSSWTSGASEFGWGDGDERTAVSPTLPGTTTARRATFFRTTFDMPTAPPATGLSLNMKLDDGLVLYLNGQEVYRSANMQGVGPNDWASAPDAGDGGWRTVTIPPSALVGGKNVLAAEVHNCLQANGTVSVDLSWNAELTASFN